MQLFGLADCNNFYCSCERTFRPDLVGKPVVVLSNNDGCIIARSEEAKALGIKMGEPFFQRRAFLQENGVAVFSSNYALYGSMSHRVMSLLAQYTPQLDVYSIDEAFLDFSAFNNIPDIKQYGEQLVHRVTKATGIPISLGIAPTYTLAKMSSKFAKKYKGYKGCCLMDTDEKRQKALQLFPIKDVWGIGRRLSTDMVYQGIHTAADFAAKSERWVRSHFTVTTLRTWKELNGIPCISLDELPQKKSICTSRSFPEKGIADVGALEEAVAAFASLCAKKMREQQSCCQNVTVFAHTSRFATDGPVHVIQKTRSLSVPTQDTSEISSVALNMLRSEIDIYRNSHLAGKDIGESADVMSSPHYKKAGVILWGFVPQNAIQQDLFDHIDRNRQTALIKAIDEINRKNGHDRVRIATEGTDVPFEPDHQYRSRQFTTDINDVLVAQI